MERPGIRLNKHNMLLVIVVAVIIVIFGIYLIYNKSAMGRYAGNTVRQNTLATSREVDAYIESALGSIQLASELVSQNMDNEWLSNPNSIIDTLVNRTPFDFIEYVDKDGINHTGMGQAFNASDRQYFVDGMDGNTGICVDYNPKYSKEYLINYYTPVYYNKKIVGVLTGAMEADSNLMPILSSRFFDEEVTSMLCDTDGHIIASTANSEDDVFLENALKEAGTDDKDIQAFCDRLKEHDEGIIEFVEKDGKAIACISTNNKTGWGIIQIVHPAVFRNVILDITGSSYITMACICLILLLLIVYFRMDSRKRHNALIEETDRVVQNYEQILTTTASDSYKGIRRVDLQTGRSVYIYFDNYHVKEMEIGDWTKWLRAQKKNMHPDDYERIIELFDIDKMRSMDDGTTFSASYRSAKKNSDGYNKIYTTTTSIISVDGRKTAIMSIIDNTSAVVSEIKQKQLLASAASIYLSMYVLDLKNDMLEMVSTGKHINNAIDGRSRGIQSIINDTMRKLTDEQYTDAMMEFVNLDTLDDRMKEVNTVTLEFLEKVSGWCRARFIAVEYDEDYHLSRVLWMVENIDAEKRKTNRLLYLSETDLMTGIRNRGSGEKRIKELIEQKHDGVFCVLDVDKFKSINDTFGHDVGDKVIIKIAECLKKTFNESDVVMRLGGDEYAVFADGITRTDEIVQYFDKFFELVNNIDIPELGERKITVSLGAAFKKNDDGLDFETMYRNADSCTYVSKKAVGNRYTIFEDKNKSNTTVEGE